MKCRHTAVAYMNLRHLCIAVLRQSGMLKTVILKIFTNMIAWLLFLLPVSLRGSLPPSNNIDNIYQIQNN